MSFYLLICENHPRKFELLEILMFVLNEIKREVVAGTIESWLRNFNFIEMRLIIIERIQ